MAYQIKWTKRADRTLYKQVNYLVENWPSQVVTEMGKVLDAKRGIRGLLINPYVRLSYRIEDDNVVLIRLTDTRQKPQ